MPTKVGITSRLNPSGKRVYQLRYNLNGKDIKQTVGTSKRQAEIARDALQKEFFNDTYSSKDAKRIGITEIFSQFIASKRNLSKASKARYTNHFKAFEKFLIENFSDSIDDIRKIKRAYIELFMDELNSSEGYSMKTLNDTLALINSIFKYAIKEQYLDKRPTEGIEKFKINKNKEREFFTQEEFELISRTIVPHWRPFIEFLYYTGLRRSELVNLKWKNVNLSSTIPTITIIPDDDYTTKTGEKRVIPLNEDAKKIIESQIGKQDIYVFVSKTGKKIHPDIPYRNLKRALKRCGLEGHLHKIRHTFASHLAMKNESIYKIGELLGHKDLESTKIYSHLSPAATQSTVNKLKLNTNNSESIEND